MASYPSMQDAHRPGLTTWVPALFAVMIICCESQKVMGGSNTSIWLGNFLAWSGHHENKAVVGLLNHVLRKAGHFTGYGLLCLCFGRGWLSILRKRIRTTWTGLRLRAGACAVASAFIVASCDEIHQSFLPGRVSCFSDVMLDTCGAATIGLIVFGILALRRNPVAAPAASTFISLGLSLSALPRRVARAPRVLKLQQSVRVGVVRERVSQPGF